MSVKTMAELKPCPTCGAEKPDDNEFCSDGFHAKGPTYWPCLHCGGTGNANVSGDEQLARLTQALENAGMRNPEALQYPISTATSPEQGALPICTRLRDDAHKVTLGSGLMLRYARSFIEAADTIETLYEALRELNLCHEARVPTDSVTAADAALARAEQSR